MGQARHRKKLLALGFGPKTRGTGYRYVNPMPEEEPTAEQIVAKQLRHQEQQLLDHYKQRRQKVVAFIYGMAEDMLRVWKLQVDKNDLRLQNFAGWTTKIVCPLPVDSEAAQVYRMELSEQQAELKSPLSLKMMDEIVDKTFRRNHHSDEVVAEILRIVRLTAEKSIEGDTFDQHSFLATLLKREKREKQRQDWVHNGLRFVHEMMTKAFTEMLRTR
jgi:hypothetical protein